MAISKENLISKAWLKHPEHREEFMRFFFKEHGHKIKEFLLSECLSANKSLRDLEMERILG